MTTTIFDQWAKMSKMANYGPFIEFSNITANLWAKLTEHNLQISNDMFRLCTDEFFNMTQSQTMEDAVSTQNKAAFKFAPKMMEYNQQYFNTLMKSATEYQKWLETTQQEMSTKTDKERKPTKAA